MFNINRFGFEMYTYIHVLPIKLSADLVLGKSHNLRPGGPEILLGRLQKFYVPPPAGGPKNYEAPLSEAENLTCPPRVDTEVSRRIGCTCLKTPLNKEKMCF